MPQAGLASTPTRWTAMEQVAGFDKIIAALHKFGAAMGEDQFVASGGDVLPASIDTLDAQIRAFRADASKWGPVNNPATATTRRFLPSIRH